MAFPISPSNGQLTTVNGVSYVYNSTSNSWTRATGSSVTLNGLVANVISANAVSVTSLTATGSQITTSVVTNLSTGNAQISGGAISVAILTTGNAQITGGSIAGNGANLTNLSGSNITSATIPNSALVNSAITHTAGTGISITGGVTSLGGAVTITNAGVTGLSSTGAGNLTVSASTGAVAVTLPTTGPGATTVGNTTAIPIITTDAYGRITSLSTAAITPSGFSLAGTSGTGSVAGNGTLTFASTNGVTATASGSTITINDAQDIRTTASPTFVGGTFSGNVTRTSRPFITNFSGNLAPTSPIQGDEWFRGNTGAMYKYVYDNVSSTYNWVNISSALYNAATTATANTLALRDSGANLTAANFIGVASSAKYADLAEIYTSDSAYEASTVVVFGGEQEITVTNLSHDTRVAGVISTNPAYLMNSEAVGLPVAFTGRVPCRVVGIVNKGDILVTSGIPGVAQRMETALYKPGCVIGKALGENRTNNIATIEVVVGRF